jgi:hypothetical protein
MAHNERIEVEIKNGNVTQGNAGSGGSFHCFIAGTEFTIDKSSIPYGQGDKDLFIASLGAPSANMSNPDENQSSNPNVWLANLRQECTTVPTKPGESVETGPRIQPHSIRQIPKDQQKGWQLEDALTRVRNEAGVPSGLTASDVFEFTSPDGPRILDGWMIIVNDCWIIASLAQQLITVITVQSYFMTIPINFSIHEYAIARLTEFYSLGG